MRNSPIYKQLVRFLHLPPANFSPRTAPPEEKTKARILNKKLRLVRMGFVLGLITMLYVIANKSLHAYLLRIMLDIVSVSWVITVQKSIQ
jgi:hypothetical protein